MIAIILFCLVVMYTPGPVNLLGLNSGIQRQITQSMGFYLGIGVALAILFTLIGYVGATFITPNLLRYLAIFGGLFVGYMGYHLMRAQGHKQSELSGKHLSFKDGLLIQLLNPKSAMVVLPVATVQFPTAHIEGVNIVIWSVLLGLLAVGAPLSYALVGRQIGLLMNQQMFLKRSNQVMGMILLALAISMLYQGFFHY
ncbi:LysE family translocator [Celerinatantimonas diazotrophica]|nr:LysE family transporter [Celerinatantimonas diazotrophica]